MSFNLTNGLKGRLKLKHRIKTTKLYFSTLNSRLKFLNDINQRTMIFNSFCKIYCLYPNEHNDVHNCIVLILNEI